MSIVTELCLMELTQDVGDSLNIGGRIYDCGVGEGKDLMLLTKFAMRLPVLHAASDRSVHGTLRRIGIVANIAHSSFVYQSSRRA